MKAVRSNAPSRIAAVRKLLSCGANVALKDKHDDTSLHFAARCALCARFPIIFSIE